MLGQVINGLIVGSMYGLVAIGFSLVLGVLDRLNFAHTEVFMVGGFAGLIVLYGGVPCIQVEVQLLYKARSSRPKDRCDFEACLPHLSGAAKLWLRDHLLLLYPAGHAWLEDLR